MQVHLIGRIVSDLGRARSFMALDWVVREFEEKLRLRPYPGTLNLWIEDPETVAALRRLRLTEGIPLATQDGFCAARCYRALIGGVVHAAVIVPEVPDYPEEKVELVAERNLKELLGVTDGDKIQVMVFG